MTNNQSSEVVPRLQALAAGNRAAISPSDVARAFGWNPQRIREREVEFGAAKLDVCRAYVGAQPMSVFATTRKSNGVDPVEGAAAYSYHASVRWGMYSDKKGLTPFNSHWTIGDKWFTLPTINWEDLPRNQTLLEAYTPANIGTGAVDRIALAREPSPKLLQPVDDALVERLDSWRDEALRTTRFNSGVDGALQNIFAQFFVLRTIEDKKLASSVSPLSEAVRQDGTLDLLRLAETYEQARSYIGSDLFNVLNAGQIPEHVLVGVIQDLYTPRRLPREYARYNFAWIDADVLGMAYEKYLSSILNPLPPSPQPDFFREAFRDVERVSVRRAGGVYYTPPYLSRYLAHQAVDAFLRRCNFAADKIELPRIVDFACGSGSFLVAALDRLLERLKEIKPDENWGKILIDDGHICGVDIDQNAVTVARLNLWNRLAEEKDPLPLPNLSNVVVQGDGLRTETWGDIGTQFDVVLGNPPFLATSKVTNREELESRFDVAKGRFDFSSLFLEQAVRVSAPEGVIGMVVPNRMFRNASGAAIRKLLTTEMNLLAVVDFGSNEVFSGVSAYIGCVLAEHIKLMTQLAMNVRVIEVQALSEHVIAGLALSLDGTDSSNRKDVRTFLAQHPRGPGAWVLLSMEEKKAQIQLSDQSTPLGSVAGVFQGIKTGANDIFVVEVQAQDEGYGAQIVNGLGDTSIIESALLRPVAYGSDVQRYDEVQPSRWLIYPYARGETIPEQQFQLLYPLAYRYLSQYREILASRASSIVSGQRWYELVRRRDVGWLSRPKLVTRDLAIETSFAVDRAGTAFLIGGVAVVPEREDLLSALLGYLNSRPVNDVLARMTPQFRGNFQKFEPRHLSQVPVVNRLLEDGEFAERLAVLAERASSATPESEARLAAARAVDELVAEVMPLANG